MQNSPNMAKVDALKVKHALPESVVLGPMPLGFTQRFNDSGAAWVCAEPSLLVESGNSDTSPDWQARCGDVIAVPSKPNTGNTKGAMLAGISCLAFQPQVNCGYCIPDAMFRGGPFSIAMIYAPVTEDEPRSLVTINPVNFENYVFLSERDGAVELTDQQASFSLRQPVTQESKGFRLVVLSRTKQGYALALEGQKPVHELSPAESPQEDAPLLDTSELCNLFIGCRSHRKGILKTLGSLLLADVFLWPDKDILAFDKDKSGAETSPEYDLLLKYYTEVICRDI